MGRVGVGSRLAQIRAASYVAAMPPPTKQAPQPPGKTSAPPSSPPKEKPVRPVEIGGPPGLDPTRYGDWEKDGRCIDF